MFAVLSDTHRTRGHALAGRARLAVERADGVLHAGDFTTTATLDAFSAASARLYAVRGNSDEPAVCARLPQALTVALAGVRVALTHTRRGGETGLAMFGRERDADLVVSGHTHRPSFRDGSPVLLNPGSHAAPRGAPHTHAELEPTDGGLSGTIRTRDGSVYDSFFVEAGASTA